MGRVPATFHEKKMKAGTSPDLPLDAIRLRGVKTHNLKNFDLDLPHRKLYVITGVSGSGKSSLAFDTLYAEGQRRYIESVSAYARQFLERMAKPDLDSASGIPPALAIQAKNSITNARSTVGTQTEINDHLRVLFARAGRLRCPECQTPVEKYDPGKTAAYLTAGFEGREARIVFQMTLGKKSLKYLRENLEELERQGFSGFFHKGSWLDAKALAGEKTVLTELLVSVDLLKITVKNKERLTDSLEQAFRLGRGEAQAWVDGQVLRFSEKSRCFKCGRSFPEPSPNLFSFNSPLGACPSCQGFGRVITIDWDLVVPDASRSIRDGVIEPWTKTSTRWEQGQFLDFCQRKRIPIRVPWAKLKAKYRKWILEGYPGDDFVSVREFFDYMNKKTYKMHVRIFLNRYRGYAPCGTCRMTRLKSEALDFRLGRETQTSAEDASNEQHSMLVQGKSHSPSEKSKVNGTSPGNLSGKENGPNTNQFPRCGNWGHPNCHNGKENKSQDGGQGKTIAEVQALSVEELLKFLETLELTPEEREKVEPVQAELLSRVRFLKDVGLGYLTLDRMSRTLSGGEVERIHLASSLGSALVDTLYVLDEPSIGLHERDNQMLIALLRKLRDLGNTVVVVEHDRTMISAADCVIDLGPTGGVRGGQLIFQGSVEELKRHPGSVTGEYLAGKRGIERKMRAENPVRHRIEVRGAKAHNLKNIHAQIPLGKFTVLTGVSGSGKSTFLYEILYNHFLKSKGRPVSQEELGTVEKIRGFEPLADMVLIDQSPLGRSPRSNPATYMKAFEDIRKIFAATPEARREGFDAGHFSFNVEKGRCPVCEGDGAVKVEMHFLADIFVPCEECHGKRFKPEVLEIRYQGKNIDEVLNMTVDEVLDFFPANKGLFEKLSVLQRIGLGYVRLGQPTLTLSGGEAQRLKLAFELSLGNSGPSLYLLDEPTTGLHEDDVRHLIRAFEELLDRGHSLLVIEHHLGMISLADHVIDLGPEGGGQGGEVVYQGTIQGLMACERSYTGQCLKQYLKTIPNGQSVIG